MAEPFGLVGMFVNVKAGDEGLVAADNDHGQQVGNHHNINQVQYGDHDGVFIHDAEIGYQVPQGFEELTGINDLGDNQAYINRQLQPAAGENQRGKNIAAGGLCRNGCRNFSVFKIES